jgi:hypothetical protein
MLRAEAGEAAQVDAEAAAATAESRAASKYDDITAPNSRYANRLTDVGHEEFGDNLIANGWSRSASKDGRVVIFQRDGAKYVLRENAKTYGGWTADFYKAGSKNIDVKIRLGG